MHPIKTGAILSAFLLSACAAAPQVDWQNGAKKAWIVQEYSPATPRAELPACLAALAPEAWAGHHFVQVRYRHVKRMHFTAAEVPATLQAGPGDEVELWPEDCSAGHLSRIAQLLPGAPQ